MKANELMIGDSIYRPDCYDNVVEIRSNGIIGQDFNRGLIPFSELKPIEITPEILEKNGFVKELDGDGIHYRFTLIQGHSQFSLLYARSVFQWLYPIDFKYIHKLQHALHLCGIEKEIIL